MSRRLALLIRTREVLRLAGEPTWAAVPELARQLEGFGWEAMLIPEHHDAAGQYCRSPLLVSAAALGATARLQVGPGVLPTGLYSRRLLPDLLTFFELAGDRALFGLGAGFWSQDFASLGVEGPSTWAELRSLVEQLLRHGVEGHRILLGVRRDRNVQWAGNNGVGVLIGSAWVPERGFVRSADLYDEARGDRSRGLLAAIAGATVGGLPREPCAADDLPFPPAADGLWLEQSAPELLSRADLLVIAPYRDGVGTLGGLIERVARP